jgi:hypothetical protein
MTDERIIAYLLDELPEEEAEQFDEDCFGQADRLEQINVVEGDLIDAYLRNALSSEQHEHFEQNYLTPARLERVLMAAALLRHVDAPQEEVGAHATERPDGPSRVRRLIDLWNSRAWGLHAVAALGLIVVIASAGWFLWFRTPTQQSVATLTLSISTDRRRGAGDRPASVRLAPDVSALSIHLKLPEQTTSGQPSRVELVQEGGKVSPLMIEARDASTVTVVIPAAQLTRGLYSLRITMTNAEGAEERMRGSYFFIAE